MYEKQNESTEAEEEKKIQHVDKKIKKHERINRTVLKNKANGLQQTWSTQLVQTA